MVDDKAARDMHAPALGQSTPAAETPPDAGLVEALTKALEPFAKAADVKLCGDWRDDQRFGQTDTANYLTFGHLRAARAALSRVTGGQG